MTTESHTQQCDLLRKLYGDTGTADLGCRAHELMTAAGYKRGKLLEN